MNLRFDHAVIGVRFLDATATEYAYRLGFSVYLGGQHTGLGTHNVIVRFGLDYLELLGVFNEAQALAAGPSRASLVEYIRQHECGALGFALATEDLDGMAARFRAEGLDALGPFPMERKRPDGVLLKWRLLIPGGTAWRRPWPFFIEWGTPDAERLQLERPGKHANGAQGVRGVTVAMRDLNRGKDLYGRQLGMTLSDEGDTGEVAWARYTVGQFWIDVVCPRMTDAVQEYFATYGEGLTQIWLATAAERSAEEHLAQRKVAVEPVQGRGGISGVRPAEGCGQNLVFIQ